MASVQLWPEANVALAVVTNCAGSPEVDRAVRAIESVVLEHFLPRPSASLLNASWPEVNPPAGAIAPLNASLLDAQVEGEALPLERWSGRVESQAFPGLSGGRQLWWTDARAGERLRLRVPTPPPGRYKLHARMCFAPDYGTVEITTGPGPPKRIVATAASLEWRDVELGEVEVGSAPVWLDVQAVDSAGEGGPRCHLGLDTLRWRPAP